MCSTHGANRPWARSSSNVSPAQSRQLTRTFARELDEPARAETTQRLPRQLRAVARPQLGREHAEGELGVRHELADGALPGQGRAPRRSARATSSGRRCRRPGKSVAVGRSVFRYSSPRASRSSFELGVGGGAGEERMPAGEDLVHEAGLGDLGRPDRAAEPVVPLEHADAPARLRKQRGGDERVDPAADRDRVVAAGQRSAHTRSTLSRARRASSPASRSQSESGNARRTRRCPRRSRRRTSRRSRLPRAYGKQTQGRARRRRATRGRSGYASARAGRRCARRRSGRRTARSRPGRRRARRRAGSTSGPLVDQLERVGDRVHERERVRLGRVHRLQRDADARRRPRRGDRANPLADDLVALRPGAGQEDDAGRARAPRAAERSRTARRHAPPARSGPPSAAAAESTARPGRSASRGARSAQALGRVDRRA